jgi:hypothetical protein
MGKRRLQPRRKCAIEGRDPGSQTPPDTVKKARKTAAISTKRRLRANAAGQAARGIGRAGKGPEEAPKKFSG